MVVGLQEWLHRIGWIFGDIGMGEVDGLDTPLVGVVYHLTTPLDTTGWFRVGVV